MWQMNGTKRNESVCVECGVRTIVFDMHVFVCVWMCTSNVRIFTYILFCYKYTYACACACGICNATELQFNWLICECMCAYIPQPHSIASVEKINVRIVCACTKKMSWIVSERKIGVKYKVQKILLRSVQNVHPELLRHIWIDFISIGVLHLVIYTCISQFLAQKISTHLCAWRCFLDLFHCVLFLSLSFRIHIFSCTKKTYMYMFTLFWTGQQNHLLRVSSQRIIMPRFFFNFFCC